MNDMMPSQKRYPKITIITPNFNQCEFLEKCMLSVINQEYPNLQFIIIDGGSSDNSVDIIKKYQDQLDYWVSEKDQGQSDAINKGLAVATGEIVNWLNADDYLEPNALSKIAEAYQKKPSASGWVGACRRVNREGTQINVIYPNHMSTDNIGQNWSGNQFYQPACFLNLAKVNEVGGVDPNLYCAMDLDLWIKLTQLGDFEKVKGIVANAIIHRDAKTQSARDKMHEETVMVMNRHGFDEGARNRYESAFNKRLFKVTIPKRLNEKLAHLKNSSQIHQMEMGPKSILILSDYLPIFDICSSADRVSKIIDILLRNNFKITYVYFNKIENEHRYKHQSNKNIEYIHLPLNLENYLNLLNSLRPDYVWMTNLWSVNQISVSIQIGRYVNENLSAKLIIDTMDFHYKKYLRKYEISHDNRDLELANNFLVVEKELYEIADKIIVVTKLEKKDIENTLKLQTPIEVLPNIHDIENSLTSYYQRKHLCFFGNFNVNHNVDAAIYFIRKILPRILKTHPNIEFHIFGSFSDRYRKAFAAANVKVLGHVENLEETLNNYCVFVCPLTYGAGMKGKIGLSASVGLPVVTTSIGAEGFNLIDGEHCFIADDPEEFAEKCKQIIRDPVTWSNFSIKSKLYIAENFSTKKVSENVANIFGNIKKDNLSNPIYEDLQNHQNDPLFSICIPTFNRASYLKQAIQSVFDQRFDSFEIIIVDDGSTDNTEEIVKAFNASKIRYFKKEHEGAPLTRNKCIKAAHGKYILWLDSDDILMPDWLNHYNRAITDDSDIDVFYGDLEIIDTQGNFKQVLQYPDYFNQNGALLSRLIIANAIPNPGTLIKRSVYHKYGDYNLDFKRAHDYEFWARIATQVKFKHIGAFVCQWRWHDTNMSSGSVQFDTSFDIQIKKDLLRSHSLQALFPHLNWQDEQNSKETAYFTIANAFNKLKGYPEAVEYYEKCIEINKKEDYYCALGLTYFQLNDLPKSIQAFDEALKINPQNKNAKEISANLKKIHLSCDHNDQTRSIKRGSKQPTNKNAASRSPKKDFEQNLSDTNEIVHTRRLQDKRIVFYALRELHLPVLLPIYQALLYMGAVDIGFMAPAYRESDDVAFQEGLSDKTLETLKNRGIPFWGHEPQKPFDCVVVADVCYDRVDGWGPIVCVGHGTISKGIFFSNNPICRRENFATVLCVPGPWYKQSFGNQVITHMAPTGFSKMDALAENSDSDTEKLLSDMGFSPGKKTILFAPTFNPELTAMEMLKDEWRKLDSAKYQVVFKLHGAAHQLIKDAYKKLAVTQSNFYYVSEPDIAPYMHACDILVSDVSSVSVEFFALGKPVILVNNPQMHKYAWYDPNSIEHQVRDAAYQIGKAEDIHEILKNLEHSDPLQQKRTAYSKQLFPPIDGHNSKRIAEQIIKVAAGEIRLESAASNSINVYLPDLSKNLNQIEENLKRVSSPVNIFSHDRKLGQIGSFPINQLAEGQIPPTPLICMTGRHVFPHQWDYMLFLTDHFSRATGVFGPLAKNKLDDRYLQQGDLSEDATELIHRNLQAYHKVHKSTSGQISPTRELSTDGLIITNGIDPEFTGHLLKKVRNPEQLVISSKFIRAAGYPSGKWDGFYCYTRPQSSAPNEKRIQDLAARLKNQPGNATIAAELKTLLTSARPMLPLSQCSKRVSIVIPYYRQLDTVKETLLSVCHQTYPNFEIIFVNDGSEDEKEVLQILEAVAQQYPEVKINYYYKDNTGLADTRNFGIEKACGEYILPLDSDDLIATNFLEKTVAFLDQNPSISFVYTEVLFWGAKNEIWGMIDFDPKVILTRNLMTCTTLFRKTMWEHLGGYDLKMNYGYEDWDFWISAVEKGYKGSNIHQPLFLYRRKRNSMLENRVHYDPLAKEQIVRNHTSLYEELTPGTQNQLRQYIGIIPPQLVRHSKKTELSSEQTQSVDLTLNEIKPQFEARPTKKILFVCHDFPPYKYAGAQLYACHLAKALNLSGYDVRIFHPVDISNRHSNENKALYDIVESTYDGLPVYQINIDEKSNPAQFWQFYNGDIEKKFKDLLLAEKFDFVHFHLLYRLSSSLPKVTKDLGVASVCTLHDYWLLCPLGHMVDSKMRACSGPESATKCAHCICGFQRDPDDQLIEYFVNRFTSMRDAYEAINTRISPSNFLAETHAQYSYSKPQVLPLGWIPIDCNNDREADEKVIFGYCGQIISRKGLDILLKALDGLHNHTWKLNIYGEGYDPAYLNMILEHIKNNDQIEYKGKFTTTDLSRIYSEIDVAVIPSRRENYPLTLLEALSAKVPVVASDVGGVREMMADKVQGFIYPKDDIESLGRILMHIFSNPQMISQMRARIKPIKTIKENAKEMDLIYQSVFNKDKAVEGKQDVQNATDLQAVILAAGRGTRLGGPNGNIPKCMALVGQETIIERQINALQAVGVQDIYVVVGYKQEVVKEFIAEKFENITFIENPIYDSTNTIYSLYLAIPFLNKDFFYLNGDVLFRKQLLEKLISEAGSGMAVEVKKCGDEEVKVRLNGRRITAISKNVPQSESIGEFIGVGLFRKGVHEAFFRNLKHEVEQNKIINDYFERALDKTAKDIEFISVDITGEPAIEIDFPEDLEEAQLLAKQIDAGEKAKQKTLQRSSKNSIANLISIIILTRNQIEYTQKCIASILKHTQRPFELIIVDNGSTDGTVEYLESEAFTGKTSGRIKIIKNKTNHGFAAGNNQGMAIAKGDYFLLMNNDIVVTADWIEQLVDCVEQRPEIGIVGPRSNCVSGPQIVENVSYDTQSLQGLESFAEGFAQQYVGQAQQVLRVVGFCMLIKHAVIEKIGGMDDRYGLGNFEDDDFSLRAAIAGFESWIAMDCFIHHFGSRTFVGEKIDYRASLLKNWDIFKTKWGLPQDLPYGSPYRLSQIKNNRFDPNRHYYPIEQESAAMENNLIAANSAQEQYTAIQANLSTKSLVEAIEALQNLIASYPDFALAYNDLGVLHYNAGKKDEALSYYEKAVQLDKENLVFQKNLADFYYAEHSRVDDALRIYVQILEANPEDVETLLITGHICVSLHKFEDAQVFYQRVLALDPTNEAARENFEKLSQIHPTPSEPKTPEEIYHQIQPQLNDADPHKIIASLTELLERFPDFALAHNDLGVLYYRMEEKEKARQHYERAVELMPANLNFQKNLADFYCIELGRIEDALKIYVRILSADPKDIDALMATAQICAALDKFDDARDFFNQVLQIEPWNAEARKHMQEMERQMSAESLDAESVEDAYGSLQEKLNTLSPHEAIAELEKLMGSYPDFAIGHNDLAVCYYNAGNKEKALHHYQQAAQLQPENITLQKNLADFLFVEQGQVEEALRIYVNILAVYPTDVETLLITGHICVALKKLDDAKVFYQRVLTLEPDNEDANQHLQAIYKRQNQNASAQPEPFSDLPVSTIGVEPSGRSPETSADLNAESQTNVSILVSLDGIDNRVKECLKSIQMHTANPHEVLLIDSKATKGMRKWAQQLVADNHHYRIVDCHHHVGWAACINQALQQACGDLVVLLHNDVVLPDGWLEVFFMGIKCESHTGVIGPMANRVSGIQQIIRTDEDDRPDFETIAAAFYEQNKHRRVITHKISDVCLGFRRELIADIGNFDEQFGCAEVAVEDFCNRVAAAGYQNRIVADTYIYHYDRHKAHKNSAAIHSLRAEDKKKYNEKWNDAQNPEVNALRMVETIVRADELRQEGQVDPAVKALLDAIGIQSEEKRLYYALAEVLIAAKRFQDAKDALLEIPPTNGNPEPQKIELLGYAEEGLANYEAAQGCVEQLLAINPQHAPALNLMGILAYHRGERDLAEQYFKQAIDADPGYGEPYTNLGALQLEAEQQAEALKSFEKGFRLTPTDLDIAANYHSQVAEIAGYEQAENVAYQSAALYPKNQKIKYMLIDFLIQQGKFEMAMPEIEDAILKFGIDDGILPTALKVREKLGPITITTSAKKVPVSVCMIIKDEEKYLARSLASVKPIVDEMIVVDTGSADLSKDIAVTFGAQVVDYNWENDFAAARNFSISQAAGEWILILDGDEVISSLDYDHFRKIVAKKPKTPVAYAINTRNYSPLANIIGWVPNDGKYPNEEAAIGWLPSEKVRLFYGKEHIRFEGAVHELVDPVLKRKNIKIEECSIPIHHYGRLEKEKLDRKGEIYFEIGQKKLSEMGEDVNALRELAIQATILERNQEALDLWQRLLAINPFSELSAIAYVNMGTVYSRLNQFEDARDVAQKALQHDPDLKEAQYNCAVAELHCGNASATVNLLENLLKGFPDYPPAQFILAAAYCCVGQKDKALERLRNQKNTPVGAYLTSPCLELGQSLIAAKQIQYASWVLGTAIECDIVNKEIIDLFNACMQMNNAAQKMPGIPQSMLAVLQPDKFENLPQ